MLMFLHFCQYGGILFFFSGARDDKVKLKG